MRRGVKQDNSRHKLVKILCGTIAAIALAILPLPALADNETSAGSDSTPVTAQIQEQQTTTEQLAAPTPLTEQPVQPAATLDATTTSTTEGGAGLQESATTTSETQPSTAANSSGKTSDSKTSSTKADASVKSKTDIRSEAVSGNASVKDNRDVGDTSTGDAEASATVLNIANANGMTAKDFQTFSCDIRQDIQGNIVIDPTTLLPFCSNNPATVGTATGDVGGSQGLQSGSSLVEIMNKIVLSAVSGDASLEGNRDAGNATTGDAAALANVVNIANTAISAQHSFVGVINIHSNLHGDILVPQSLVDSLAGSGSLTMAGHSTTDIQNNIKASAVSGDATVTHNRTGGNATTGDAATSLTVMNLTGQEVVAKNSLLVFVNVLGEWMGMIVPAPGGNTAMLGSGIQASGQATTAGGSQAGDHTARITNDISVNAQSGNASVTSNRDAGNATSGKASAGVNLLNITNSNFKLDDWFGALFINVLGGWLGNFDIQKAVADSGGQAPVSDVQVYQLEQPVTVTPVAAPVTRASTIPGNQAQTTTPSTEQVTELTSTNSTTGNVLGSSTRTTTADGSQQGVKLDLVSLIAIITALTLVFALAVAAFRHRLAA